MARPVGMWYPSFKVSNVASTWNFTGSLHTPRAAYAGCLLNSGKILIACGEIDDPGTPTNTCELYDPNTGTWSFTGSASVARSFHTCVKLHDGTVLMVGGVTTFSSGTCTATCEIYDPVAETWSTTGSLPAATAVNALYLLANGKVLQAGGTVSGTSFNTVANTCALFDPNTGLWTATGALNVARQNAGFVLLQDGTPLIISGRKNGGGETNTAEKYSVGGGTWSATAGVPVFGVEFDGGNTCITLPSGKVLSAGGVNNVHAARELCQLYDPNTDSFASTGSLSTGTGEACIYNLNDGTVLYAGGQIGVSPENSITTTELYNPNTELWTVVNSLNAARGTGPLNGGIQLANGTPLWAGGADNVGTIYTSTELYQTGAPPSMAITQVQAVDKGTLSSDSPTITISATSAGNLIVAQISNVGTRTVSSVTDNVSNMYVFATGSHQITTNHVIDTWYCQNCSAGATTVTVNFSGSCNSIVSVEEYSGVKTSGALDTANALYTAAGSTVGPSLTPSATGELLTSAALTDDFFLTGVNSPWTASDHESSVDGFAAGYYVNAPLSAQQCPFTPTTSGASVATGAVFFPAATGASAKKKASTNLV